MTRTLRALAVLAVVATAAFGGPATAGAEQKIGYIRSSYILSRYEPYREAIKIFQAFEAAENDSLRKKSEAFQLKVETAQKQAALMTEEQRLEKSRELERENAALEEYSRELYDTDKGKLSRKYAELLEPIMKHVQSVIKVVRVKEGYTFVFEGESEQLIDADEQFDLSEKVITVLIE